MKLLRYVSGWDFFIMGCEIVFCIFIFYYVVEEILELHVHQLRYLSSIWNILDLVVILVTDISPGLGTYWEGKSLPPKGNLNSSFWTVRTSEERGPGSPSLHPFYLWDHLSYTWHLRTSRPMLSEA